MITDEWIEDHAKSIVKKNQEKYTVTMNDKPKGIILTTIIIAFVEVVAKKIFKECISVDDTLTIKRINNPGFLLRSRLIAMIRDEVTIAIHENRGEGVLDEEAKRHIMNQSRKTREYIEYECFHALRKMGERVQEKDLPLERA